MLPAAKRLTSAASVLTCAALAAACSRPVKPARTTLDQPVFAAETEAAERQKRRRCSDNWSLLLPGVGQMCRGKIAEGSMLAAGSLLELGTVLAVAESHPLGYSHPGAAIPLVALQDLWIYSNMEPIVDRALARRALYAPQESLADLLAAPFNIQVLKKPSVWAGTLGLLALGIGASWLLDRDQLRTDNIGGDPNVFGRTLDGRIGYPIGVGVGVGLFSHVAIAEEYIFRGALQSGLARKYGHTQGWLWASLAFGLTHSLNIFALRPQDRGDYLRYAVPFITGVGSYLGYAYVREGYSLSVPVAIHFWYDLLLSTTFFVIDPQNAPISASLSWAF